MEPADGFVEIHGKNISHNAPGSATPMALDRLFPALLECFGIILCGYIAGRADIITGSQAKGLGQFVSKFALPALLFKNMVLLDFGDVIWAFLWSVLVAKVAVFSLVCVLTLMVASPETRYSKAGLYAIFATQSNDFALGYPIVDALYRSTSPEYLQYIYLVAPVSLMILNPIGFSLCEIQRWKQASQPQRSTLGILAVVVLQVLKNPIVFMVVVGIAGHFALGRHIPAVLSEFIDGLANSFGGAALFYLGLSMVGQLRKLTRDTGVALILLITAKLLVMPLVCKDMVDLLDGGGGNVSSVNHTSLSNFAFLYGVFPTAPSVAIYASQYNMELEVVTSGMVISTFLSAPIMYVSAWLLTIPLMEATPLMAELQNVSFNISIVCIIALVWTIAVMLLSKKFNRLPHLFALNLFLAQFLVCVCMVLWNFVVKQEDGHLGQTLTFILLYGSLYSTYIWTGLIPLCLALTNRDDLLRLRPGVFMVLGWGVPFLMVGCLMIAGVRTDTIDSAFFYGRAQIITTAVVLAFSLVLGGVSLMGLSQGSREQSTYEALDRASVLGTADEPRTPGGLEDYQQQQYLVSPSVADGGYNADPLSCSPLQALPDMIASTQRNHTHNTGHSGAPPQSSASPEEPLNLPPPGGAHPPDEPPTDDRQTVRHVLLCLLLNISLLANISSCFWWLLNRDPGRLYLELQFFCAVANYGQGFISFGIFGLDRHLIILPFKKRLQGLWGRGRDSEDGRSPTAAPEEVRLTCTQFVRYHKDQCVQDIVHTRRCLRAAGGGGGAKQEEEEEEEPKNNNNTRPHHPTPLVDTRKNPVPKPPDEPRAPPGGQIDHSGGAFFRASDLIGWLLGRGVCADRGAARRYAARLQQGGVLLPLTGGETQQSAVMLYRFTAQRHHRRALEGRGGGEEEAGGRGRCG